MKTKVSYIVSLFSLMHLFFLFLDGESHPMDMDPMMLTILGIIAGVLIVIIIVTLAIRIHASRSRGRLRTRASSEVGNGNPSGNKVVVTTIEELDIDHNSSTASLMVMMKKDDFFLVMGRHTTYVQCSFIRSQE